jgi:enoyl-CoA hydratase
VSEPLVVASREGEIVTLAFNDPDRLNAMTRAMGEALAERVAELRTQEDLRAVVLTGRGRAFSAGGDLDMIQGNAERARKGARAVREIRDEMRSFYGLFLSVRELPCPTLAAIGGHAVGAGLCVALACDLRMAAVDAKLGLNFTRLGLHPGMAATWTLPRLVGPARAAELLYASRTLTGREAAEIGLVSRALPREEVLPAVQELAREIAGCGPAAVRAVKRALARSPEASLSDQLDLEAREQAATFATQDVREGLAAARERRPPRFRDA